MIKLKQEEEKKLKIQREKIVGVARGKADNKNSRPISATYDLSNKLVLNQNLNGVQSVKNINQNANIKKSAQTGRPSNKSTNVLQTIAETPQNSLNPKFTPINNPFKQRPVSHMVFPKREPEQPNSQRFKSSYQTVQPEKEAAIDELLLKIYQLDDQQRHQLFLALKDMESKGNLNQLNQGLQKFLQPPEKVERQINADPKTQTKLQSHNELVVRIISTLGNPHVCGLTEIELFDSNATKIPVAPACILIRNLGKGPKVSAEKLINGQKLTNNEKNMWLGYLPPPNQNLEVVIYYSKDVEIGGLKLWNYNKGIIDCTKGVQKVIILVNNLIKWEGRLDPGKGNVNVDYSKQIIIKQGVQLPSEIQTKQEVHKVEVVYRPEIHKVEIVEPNLKKDKSALWFEPLKPKHEETKTKIKKEESPPQNKVRDTKAAIANAVSSVNKVLQNRGSVVEESLDSLDFFKVTNLGRLQNVENKQKWNAEQSTVSQGSKKNYAGPQIARSTLPEDFMNPSPGVNQSRKGTVYRKIEEYSDLESVKIKQPQKAIKQPQITKIPNLPQGRILKFNILKTWGDMNYLGLTGIEVFDDEGKQVVVNQISACPPDINVLPDYGDDPRTVDKLVDGNYFTNDDLHVWLTPFTSGEDHTITIDFGRQIKVSMIRIWNYNKSRIHSYRGARQITAELDQNLIFNGEIRKAPGAAKDPEACCEIILFTENLQILEKIDANDWLNQHDTSNFDQTQKLLESLDLNEERPMTATKKFSETEIEDLQFQLQQQKSKPTSLFDERPQTSAIVQKVSQQQVREILKPISKPKEEFKVRQMVNGRKIWINITESWGDLFYVGLNGIEVLNSMNEPIPITVNPDPLLNSNTCVKAVPRDMNAIPGHGQDHRTLEKLFNEKNNTTDDRNMWLIPFNKGENHTISIDLGEVRTISGLKFYNYNKSVEDSLRGARQVVIKVDDVLMTPKKGITLRRGPGYMLQGLDFGQLVNLPFKNGWTNEQIVPVQKSITQKQDGFIYQEYDAIGMPVGFIVNFNFYNTHGDLYYIGLNGIQIYDQNGNGLLKPGQKICANPPDIRQLQGMQNDVRTCEKLVNGVNETQDDSNMWLAPFKNTKSCEKEQKREPNFVCFLFDRPTAISAIQIWNYTKTIQRGVNEFEIEVDGNKIFRGYLKAKSSNAVIFHTDGAHIDQLIDKVNFNPSKRQNVVLLNERKIMGEAQKTNEKFVFDEMARPQTKAVNNFM